MIYEGKGPRRMGRIVDCVVKREEGRGEEGMVKGRGGNSTCEERGGTTGLRVAIGSERRTGESTDESSCEETNGEVSTVARTSQFDNSKNGFRVAREGELSEG